MKAKSVLYAAVGAPAVAVRKVSARANDLGSKLTSQAGGYSESFGKAIDDWAIEGEKIVGRITDGKVVDELTSKVDLEQAKEQVGKLRDQLEDMLSTWRSSFRPEKAEAEKKTSPAKPSSAKSTGSKAAAPSTSSKTSAAKTAKSTATKTSPEKSASTSEVDKAS